MFEYSCECGSVCVSMHVIVGFGERVWASLSLSTFMSPF